MWHVTARTEDHLREPEVRVAVIEDVAEERSGHESTDEEGDSKENEPPGNIEAGKFVE